MWDSISAVIPIYNSSNSLEELYHRLSKFFTENFYYHEIIMVDDGSRDNSYEMMLSLRERDSRVKIISLDGNFGQQNALMCGFKYTTGNYIVTMDDDLQHLPEEIKKLVVTIEKGYDVVYGITDDKHHQLYRNLGSKITNYLFNMITPKKDNIRVSSFRIIRRSLLEKIITHKTAFVYISAIILKHTNNIANVKVKHDDRKYGKSNYTFLKLVKLFCKLYIYYSDFALMRLFRSNKPQYVIRDIKGC